MPKYKVKVIYKYSDYVYVEADNKEEAIKIAANNSEEEYESFTDAFADELEPEEASEVDYFHTE